MSHALTLGTLTTAPALDHPELLAPPVTTALAQFSGADKVFVAPIDSELADTAAFCEAYGVALVRATRAHEDIELGASPRATVALYRASQAAAFLAGRRFVLPDDVKAVARAVLAHRLVVDLDQSLRGASVDRALAAILDTLPVPPIAAR